MSEGSLDYYLNNLESRRLIELRFVKKDNGGSGGKLKLPVELFSLRCLSAC